MLNILRVFLHYMIISIYSIDIFQLSPFCANIYLQIMTSLVTQETKISSALLDETDNHNASSDQNVPSRHKTPPSSQKKLKSYKIIVLGESGVGKTCLSFRFCAGRFPLHSEATIGLDFREKVKVLIPSLSLFFCIIRLLKLMERD